MPSALVPVMILVLGFGPGLFWLWYFYKQDEVEPEPLYLIRNCFFLGMLTVLPVYVIERSLASGPIFDASLMAPLVEETAKFLAVVLTIYRHSEFDEPMDGVVYTAAVALGFASLENVGYLLDEYYRPDGTLAGLSLIRAVFSVPGHAIWSGMWGYALGFVKCARPRRPYLMIFTGLAVSMVMHGAFNFLVHYQGWTIVALALVIPVGWEVLRSRIRDALLASPHASSDEKRRMIRLEESVERQSQDAPWYQNRLIVVSMLFVLFPPLGLYGLWTTPRFSVPVKWTYLMLWIYLMIASVYHTCCQGG
jgi:protease PrsW